MPQAAFIAPLAGAVFAHAIAAGLIKAVLIQVALGSLEYRDCDGELWIACNE